MPNSSPMYPPPTTTTWSGNSLRLKASLDEMTLSSNFMKGSSTGIEPLARITFSPSMIIASLPLPTLTVLASWNSAQPLTNSTPAFLRRCSTPLFNLSTMSSFQPTIPAMLNSAGPGIDIPMWPSLAACFARSWNRCAA